MNTHDIDIELPAEFRSGNDIPVTQDTIKRERMEEVIRDAIEADRKRRGEPVAWLVRDDMLGTWLFRPEKPEQGLWKYVKPLYDTPQPAEPDDLDDWRTAALAAVSHLDYETDAPAEVKQALRVLNGALNGKRRGEPADKSANLQSSSVDRSTEMQSQTAEPVKCLDPSMGEHACSNRAQCWEPCGELGNSVEHAHVAEPVHENHVPVENHFENRMNAYDTAGAQPAEPHPPHRDCMCAECAPSFEDYSAEPVGYILMESGKPVAFFDEIPAESHYDASAYIPVGVFGKPADPRLDAPAQVGHTRFGEGIPWSTVIGAAQRYHAAQNTPAKEKERLQRAAENIKALHQAEPVKVPSDDVLADALSNLEHDNYEQSYSGYKNRQADIALIRAALARYGNNPGAAHE